MNPLKLGGGLENLEVIYFQGISFLKILGKFSFSGGLCLLEGP